MSIASGDGSSAIGLTKDHAAMHDMSWRLAMLEKQIDEMAGVIRHFMGARPDELEVRRRVSFATAERIYAPGDKRNARD